MLKRIVVLMAGVLVVSSAYAAEKAKQPRPIKALMITGGCCHDYPQQKEILAKAISARAPPHGRRRDETRWTSQ